MMRTLIAFLLSALTCLGVDATWDFRNAAMEVQGVKTMALVPLYVYDTNNILVTADRLTRATSSAGSVTITNVLQGYYRTEFTGPNRVTTNWFIFPNTNGAVNAWLYKTNWSTLPTNTWLVSVADLNTTSNVLYSAIGTGGSGTNLLPLNNEWTGDSNVFSGAVSAASFTGDGSGLTGIATTNSSALWVNAGGSTGVRGVKERPYPTIAAAVADAQSGDVLFLSGPLTIPTNTLVQNLTIIGDGSRLTYSGSLTDGDGLVLSNAVVSGVSVTNTGSAYGLGLLLQFPEGCGTVTIRDCNFYGADTAAVFEGQSDAHAFTNNFLNVFNCRFSARQTGVEFWHVNGLIVGSAFYVNGGGVADTVGAAVDNDSATNVFVGCYFEAAGGVPNNTAFKTYAFAHSTLEGCAIRLRPSAGTTNSAAVRLCETYSTVRANACFFDIVDGLAFTSSEPDGFGGWIAGPALQRAYLAGCNVYPPTNTVIVWNLPATGGGPTSSNYFSISGGNITKNNLFYTTNAAKLDVRFPPGLYVGDGAGITNLDGAQLQAGTVASNAFGATALEYIAAAGGGAWADIEPSVLDGLQYGSANLTNFSQMNTNAVGLAGQFSGTFAGDGAAISNVPGIAWFTNSGPYITNTLTLVDSSTLSRAVISFTNAGNGSGIYFDSGTGDFDGAYIDGDWFGDNFIGNFSGALSGTATLTNLNYSVGPWTNWTTADFTIWNSNTVNNTWTRLDTNCNFYMGTNNTTLFSRVGGWMWMSNVTVSVDKDWNGKALTNVGTFSSGDLTVNSGGAYLSDGVGYFRVAGGGSATRAILAGTRWALASDGSVGNLKIFTSSGLTSPASSLTTSNINLYGSITATNGLFLPQLVFIPTNSIPASSSVITNYVLINLTNVGPVYVATNYQASGSFILAKPTLTLSTWP